MLDLTWMRDILHISCLCAQAEKTILEEKGKEKDRLLQLKESELLTNIQLKDTEVRKHDNQLAETRQELSVLQVYPLWYCN